jgi:hypothetical protein
MDSAHFWDDVIETVLTSPHHSRHTKSCVVGMLRRMATARCRPTTGTVIRWLKAQHLSPGTCVNYSSRIAASVRLAFPAHSLHPCLLARPGRAWLGGHSAS